MMAERSTSRMSNRYDFNESRSAQATPVPPRKQQALKNSELNLHEASTPGHGHGHDMNISQGSSAHNNGLPGRPHGDGDPGYSSGETNEQEIANLEDLKPIQIKKHQFTLIHKTCNSTVYKSTFKTGRGYILKRIKNTKGGQYELLQTKYSNKICPEYTLPIIRNKSSSNHIYILQPEYGMSLYDYMVQRGAALIESELRFIYGHVALALFRLHEKAHLAHLDIKEENILINPETLHPVLIDFATCRPLKKSEPCPQHLPKQLGSAGFSAPELCRGDPLNDLSKCDVYSYGVALFSSLTGTYPTNDEKTGKLNQQRPEIMSIELWEVISACIYAKSPMERPSLEELLEFDFFRM